MEQNMTAAMPEMGSSKQQGNGLKIATAIASVIAVCGIGFGVYGMVQSSQKDNQISDLKVQIKNEDGSVTTIETPKIETTTENGGTTVTITDSTVSAENTEDYIYVGEWGLKIKKPETLVYTDYKFDNEVFGSNSEPGEFVYEYVEVRGVVSGTDMNLAGEYLRYADSVGCYNAKITRVAKTISDNDKGRYGTEVFSDNSYYYMYQHGQAACSNSDELTPIEESSNLLIIEMLSNSDNYSKI